MRRFTVNNFWKLMLVVGLPVAVAVLQCSQPDELGRWKATLNARGETLSMKALASPLSAETTAAMEQFSAAANRLRVGTLDPSTVSPMKSSAPGYAKSAWAEESPAADVNVRTRWSDFATQLKDNAEILAQVRALLRTPPRGPSHNLVDPFGSTRPSFVGKRIILYWLWGAEVDALHRGSLDEALPHLQSILALARMNDEEFTLINQMVRTAIVGLATSATWEALQAPGWDESRLVALQNDWDQVCLLPKLEQTFETERAYGVMFFEYARTNGQGAAGLLGGLGLRSTNGLARAFNAQVYLPIWQKAWSAHDELFFLKRTQPILEGIRTTGANCSYAAMQRFLEAGEREGLNCESPLSRFRYQVGNALLPKWERVLELVMRQETLRQIVITAVALRRHQLRHGSVPVNLQRLVPEFIPTLPRDYMTGRTLLFERNDDDSFVLYSAGENGRDENAMGDDLVWPLAGLPGRISDPAPNQTNDTLVVDDMGVAEVVRCLALLIHLPLEFDPKLAQNVTNRICIRFESVTMFEALEGILSAHGLALTRGAKHRLNCIITNPYPIISGDHDITGESSSGELVPLIAIESVPLPAAIRSLARQAHIDYQLDPRVTGHLTPEVTRYYRGMCAEAALKSLLREHGLVLFQNKNSKVLRVTLP